MFAFNAWKNHFWLGFLTATRRDIRMKSLPSIPVHCHSQCKLFIFTRMYGNGRIPLHIVSTNIISMFLAALISRCHCIHLRPWQLLHNFLCHTDVCRSFLKHKEHTCDENASFASTSCTCGARGFPLAFETRFRRRETSNFLGVAGLPPPNVAEYLASP
jgi:hypothetical protein